jgi:hypothetical protein
MCVRAATIAVALLLVYGCDSDDPGSPAADQAPSDPAGVEGDPGLMQQPIRSPILGHTPFKGRLQVSPSVAAPGDELIVRVQNTGSRRMYHGACPSAQRRVDGRWINANEDLFGREEIFCILILHSADPGGLGPKLGGRGKFVPLPANLEPGRYRLIVGVHSGPLRRPDYRLRLHGAFRVT